MENESFINLINHSHFSLLNALPKIKDLVKEAKNSGMKSLSLTDNGNLYGAIQFYKECESENIKPIIGVHAYLASRTRLDKQSGIDNLRYRLILLAKNENGYKNLIRLVSLSHLEGFYYKPRIDKEILEKYAGDLICLSPFFGSETSSVIKSKNKEKLTETINWYKKIFGPENFFLQISRHPEMENNDKEVDEIIEIAKKTNTNIVASQETYYLKLEDRKVREVLMAIQTNSEIRENENSGDFSFPSAKQFKKLFKGTPEALENASKIAEMCNLKLELGKWIFPGLQIPEGSDYPTELRKSTYKGIKEKGLEENKELHDRIEYELKIIIDKGYAPYFLVVSDLLNFAKTNGIFSTTRGSAAGSIVSYLNNITTVNPLEYKLPFERFLNPERPKAPDIDMDFADNRRNEMIEYARKKYGADKVAQIGTFGTMMARGSVRDVARAMGFPYGLGDRIAKLIPFGSQGFPMTIKKAMEIEPELKKMYKEDEDVKTIIDTAKKIEGCARHISVHAAGVVISPTTLTDFTPIQYDPKGENKVITQYDMHAVEDAGLLKFDFLGIRNLAILADAISLVEKIENKKIDIEKIPIDDKKTFEMLAKGETSGLFQLNGQGMTRYLKELRPTTITDINAMVALYRPGPLESIPKYIERKHNPKLVSYLDPRMKDILIDSYGVITYQDDILLIAVKLAGFSWLEVDKLRKAMGKKIPKEMEEQKEKLITGFVKNGMAEDKAKALWALVEPFASYGFNKAHAASYGKVAYQTAYMKAHFPTIYMSSILTAESGDIEKISEIINECKRMNIAVLPPDINQSFGVFSVIKGEDKIRFGLYTIKNFGQGIADIIIEERKLNGKFSSLGNFLKRIKDKNLNKKSLESLIKSGALDKLGERSVMLENLESLLNYHKEINKSVENQDSLFGTLNDTFPEPILEKAAETKEEDKWKWEKELLGLYVSGHPLDKFREKMEKVKMNIAMIKDKMKEGMEVIALGIIEEAKTITTKNGGKMVFLKLSDHSSNIETVVFSRVYDDVKDLLNPDNCVVIRGKISHRNGGVSLIADSIKGLTN